MKMDIRKNALMMALICLIGFQPVVQAHSVRFEVKFVGALVAICALFNIRYVADGIGGCFKCAGDFFQYLARVKIFEDNKDLIAAKTQFDNEFKKFCSEQNISWRTNVYNCIPQLISTSDSEETSRKVTNFLEENVRKPYSGQIDYLSLARYHIAPQAKAAINAQLSSLCMDEAECHVLSQVIQGTRFEWATNLHQFIDYAVGEIRNYRQTRNKNLIALYCSHLPCQLGTQEKVERKLIDAQPGKIIEVFSAAGKIKNISNSQGMAEIKTDAMLAICGQHQF